MLKQINLHIKCYSKEISWYVHIVVNYIGLKEGRLSAEADFWDTMNSQPATTNINLEKTEDVSLELLQVSKQRNQPVRR